MDISYHRLGWDNLIDLLSINEQNISMIDTITTIQKRLECEGAPVHVQEQLIDLYPHTLGLSLFLCTTRFSFYSRKLMVKIFQAIQRYSDEQMVYCIEKFHTERPRPQEHVDDKLIIGEAMTLIFASFDDYSATPQSGNLNALKIVRERYPESILHADSNNYTPLHGVSSAFTTPIFQFFIEWHLDQRPNERGGLYHMNGSGITPLDGLIGTYEDILPTLQWLCSRTLLQGKDIHDWHLIHRAAFSSSLSTIQFLLKLYPSGALQEDQDGNLPLDLFMSMKYREQKDFSEDDFEIIKVLIKYGVTYGGYQTVGGLFHLNPSENDRCTLTFLLQEVGNENEERLWQIIDEVITDYTKESQSHGSVLSIMHGAVEYKQFISNEMFQTILLRYGASCRNLNDELPLMSAIKKGVSWDDCGLHILNVNKSALYEVDPETNLPLFLVAACRKEAGLNTVYSLSMPAVLEFSHENKE